MNKKAREEMKILPFGEVWNEFCSNNSVPSDLETFRQITEYEKSVLLGR